MKNLLCTFYIVSAGINFTNFVRAATKPISESTQNDAIVIAVWGVSTFILVALALSKAKEYFTSDIDKSR
jgi:hypothetical protein